MSYELHFHPLALKEWKKLSQELQEQFKKQLKPRLENPHVISAKLSGQLKDCYKIKLHQAGYRLVYVLLCHHATNTAILKTCQYEKFAYVPLFVGLFTGLI